MSVSEQPINRNPSSLLRFLGFSGPDSPSRLADQAQGTVDLLPWWSYANEQKQQGTFTPAAALRGYVAVFTVPLTQRWIVNQVTARAACSVAAHQYNVACAYDNGAATGAILIGPASGTFLTPADAATAGLSARNDFVLLGPGDTLGVYLLVNVGATPGAVFLVYTAAVFAA